ncbi:type VI secretion system contractile sheath small subunit [Pusillimonas sp. SM2304]|uniref:type VI secretion system contractile sheath small subunit n=1 Tax=Pusillimonas sp. SM2304 TaxID=3073241 RepID=UPI0028741514|nr:type VI secretion system contractile sheath small subunit [Pusillimonas sp. SM2304]MDS1142260.1 type VI secretion system contractile sheath small subunit [Pusillimonas sp. SM2304]
MATSKSGQKFVARNRAPRVQIEYDVEIYGAERTINLPFVMGVMADLAGKSTQPQPEVADRKFMDVDIDNFDDRMKAIKPRVAFHVPNTLTGDGQLAVDIEFNSINDFSPATVANKVEALKSLLDARTELANLLTYMDGKTGAEELIGKVLENPALMSTLASAPKPQPGTHDADGEDSGTTLNQA